MLGPLSPNINSAGVNPVALATVLLNHDSIWGTSSAHFLWLPLQYIRKKGSDFLHAPLTGV
jgi:hypothetical protein